MLTYAAASDLVEASTPTLAGREPTGAFARLTGADHLEAEPSLVEQRLILAHAPLLAS